MNILNTITGFISAILISIATFIAPTVSVRPSATPTLVLPSPIPTERPPSERALKAAAFVYLESNKDGQKKWEQKMLATGSADLTIKRMAQELDGDQTKLIIFETAIQKYQGKQNSYSNETYDAYSPPAAVVQPNTNSESSLEKYQRESRERCQDEINQYTTCMSEYNSKMIEYNSCEAEKLYNEWKFCYKPVNLCGFKPFCSY